MVIEGGRLSGQAWTLPNDLDTEAQVGAGKTLPSQGRGQLFVVHDPRPEETGDCSTAFDPFELVRVPVNYRGICKPDEDPRLENPDGIDGQACLPQFCCDNIKHLCGVPLCPPCDQNTCPGIDLGGRYVLSGPTSIVGTGENGQSVPNCVPFPLPSLCCE